MEKNEYLIRVQNKRIYRLNSNFFLHNTFEIFIYCVCCIFFVANWFCYFIHTYTRYTLHNATYNDSLRFSSVCVTENKKNSKYYLASYFQQVVLYSVAFNNNDGRVTQTVIKLYPIIYRSNSRPNFILNKIIL